MNTQSDFNVLNLRPDLGERLASPGVPVDSGSGLRSGIKGALVAVAAQALIVVAGALFSGLCGLPLRF